MAFNSCSMMNKTCSMIKRFVTASCASSAGKIGCFTLNRTGCCRYHTDFAPCDVRSTVETGNQLSKLENVYDILKNVDILYNLVKGGIFIYDDRIQEALKQLRVKKSEISDYETLLRVMEIFYRVGESESMMSSLLYFSNDVPYMPDNVLVSLTRYFNKTHRESSLTRSLQSQLYLNTCMSTSGNVGVDNVLYSIDVIEDNSIVKRALKEVDFAELKDYDKVFNSLKLYYILLSRNGGSIKGFMDSALRVFENMLNSSVGSSEGSGVGVANEDSGTLTSGISGTIKRQNDYDFFKDKYIINCYRMLIKIKNYESLDYGNVSSIIDRKCIYNSTDLRLLLKDVNNCTYTPDESLLACIIRAIFANVAHLSKDDMVLAFKFFSKYHFHPTSAHLELLNVQALLHMSEYTARDALCMVNYYSSLGTGSGTFELMEKLYDHLISKISATRLNQLRVDASSVNETVCRDVDGIVGGGSSQGHNDVNIYIYALSKLIKCLSSAPSAQRSKTPTWSLKKYVRAISFNLISLSDRTVAYCLYTFYKINHDPVKLIYQLLPSLHKRMDNSVDLVQTLLFFSRFRYSSFYQELIRKVGNKLINNEFNDLQLVIISRCLCKYKKIFTNQLFTHICSKLDGMNTSQICTVFNSYSKSDLNGDLMINKLNQRLRDELINISNRDAMSLLLPIKKKCVNDEKVIAHISTLDLDPSDRFDVFGKIPKGQLTDVQVVKCLLCLSEKPRSELTDKFARELFTKAVKMAPGLSQHTIRRILNSVQCYGYSKPKLNRILTNRFIRNSRQKRTINGTDLASSSGARDERNESVRGRNLLTYFRHISLGPPHLSPQLK